MKSMRRSFCRRSSALIVVAIAAFTGLCFTNAPAHAAVHEVNQVGFTFDPAEVAAAPGDTIRWIWNSGTHTVTSGTDCTPDGVYFNESLTSDNPLVEYEIPGDFSGVIDYFCIFHCTLGMTGSITVESPCPADFDGDGDVDTADLLFLLGAWGTGNGDVDGDGDTDTADLLDLLAAWGACP
jgi:plastocyanin